jgi:hypothetical protein
MYSKSFEIFRSNHVNIFINWRIRHRRSKLWNIYIIRGSLSCIISALISVLFDFSHCSSVVRRVWHCRRLSCHRWRSHSVRLSMLSAAPSPSVTVWPWRHWSPRRQCKRIVQSNWQYRQRSGFYKEGQIGRIRRWRRTSRMGRIDHEKS